MTTESAILRAYALLSQGEYEDAERMLAGAQGALDTPSGADLLARLRFEQGFDDEARQIWSRIHEAFPDFEPATKALEAFENPPPETEESEETRRVFPVFALLVLLAGVGLATWGFLRKPETVVRIEERVLTNTVEKVVNVPVVSCTTSFVDRVSYVTNVVRDIQTKFVTNTIVRVETNEVPKIETRIVYRDPVVAQTNAVTSMPTVATGVPIVPQADAVKPSKAMPHVVRPATATQGSWADRAILGIYTKMGLLPEPKTRLPTMWNKEK